MSNQLILTREMLASQAFKKLLPSGLLQAQAACGSRFGADAAFQVSGSETFHSDGVFYVKCPMSCGESKDDGSGNRGMPSLLSACC